MISKWACVMLIFILMGLSAFSQEIILNEETNGTTVTTCSATLYDSGGPDGNYQSSETYRITFCAENPNSAVVAEIVYLNTEIPYDYLKIYDGSNTEGAPLGTVGGTNIPAKPYESTPGNCLTIYWRSDVSVTRAGFQIAISCKPPCQDFTVEITPEAVYSAEEEAYLGCSGGIVTSEVNFNNNDVNYHQSVETSTFSWSVLYNNDTQTFAGLGMSDLSEALAPGAYSYTLTVTDNNRCSVVSNTVTVFVSGAPTFEGTVVTSEAILGTEVQLNGVVNPPDEWYQTVPQVSNEQICINDQHSVCFVYSEFEPDQTIQSASDIESVGLQLEHSYMGDLDIYIQCPNGQRMTLFEQACSRAFFGEPIDCDVQGVNSSCDGPEWVGIGYDYYWTAENNNGLMSANCPGPSIPLPAGNYQPVDSFSNLIGCPLNGEWCVIFVDNMGVDDGTVFRTELHFADNIYPADEDLISLQCTYGNEMWWEGEALQYEGMGANNIAIPTTIGQVEYTFSATDNYGCTYDTTLTVIVREFPCQDYAVSIVTDAQYNETDGVYLGCPGTTVSAQIYTPNNNENYEQTVENITFLWRVYSNNNLREFEGLGMSELPVPLETGIYLISLTTIDSNGCQIALEDIQVYISVPPTFSGTTAVPEITSGTEVALNGVVNPPSECSLAMPEEFNNEQFCMPDSPGQIWSSCFSVTEFAPDQTIQSASDIASICVDIEHAYLGDLDIWITCPSGNRMDLLSYYGSYQVNPGVGSGNHSFLGEPVDDNNDPCNPGVPYHYCWTPDATYTIPDMAYNPPTYSYTDNAGNSYTDHKYIPAGDYYPSSNYGARVDWTSLMGCPLNGEWCIKIKDCLSLHDGTIFQTELHFTDNVRPAISFQNTYGNEIWWEGEALQYEGMGANNIAIPTTLGQVEYTFSATDNFGCTYDTTLYVNVLTATGIDVVSDDDILVFPNPVNDMLTITSSETISEIEIVNDKGQIVRRMDVNGNTAACNVSELASGVYVVRIYNRVVEGQAEGSVVWQRKFVKE
ncbi:MAG: T9SS type A sorting domain-containing protein [Bacteroidales bacterium]|nr:T9SS type A sorting domain-containing protein [Bacteroidales bacterium]